MSETPKFYPAMPRPVIREPQHLKPHEKATAYHLARAEAELELAQRAFHRAAVQAHYELAGAHLDRVYGARY